LLMIFPWWLMMVHSPCWHHHLSEIRISPRSRYLNATEIGCWNWAIKLCVWMQARNSQLFTYKEVVV
jgi:hypothetical protein